MSLANFALIKRSNQLILAICLLLTAFELAFIQSLVVNIAICLLALLMFIRQGKFKSIIALLIIPALPAVGAYLAFYLHSQNPNAAIIYASRTYAYAALGLILALGVDLEELLLHLSQLGFPRNFTYGILVVIHALPAIQRELKNSKMSAELRGKPLHFWSPLFYIKAIMTSLFWSDKYSVAMYAHAYDEQYGRSRYIIYKLDLYQGILTILIFITLQIFLLLQNYL